MSSYTDYDYVTIKYNSTGVPQWVSRYNGGVNSTDRAISLAYSGGRVHVTGASLNSSGIFDIVTVSYDYDDGSELWVKSYPGRSSNWWLTQKNSIAADYSRGVYVTGLCAGYCVLIKYDPSNGDPCWVNTVIAGQGTSLDIFSKSIGNSWPHTNDIFVTGLLYNGSSYAFGVVKYDDDGDFQWLSSYSHSQLGDYGVSLCVDNTENVCATGIVYDENGFANYGTVIYDKDGNYIHDDIYDGGYGTDVVHGITVDPNGNFYITGEGSGNNLDYLTIKYSPSNQGNFSFQNQSQMKDEVIPSFYELKQNYPNPFNPVTQIKYAMPQNGNVILKVYDMLGREVSTLVNEYKNAGNYIVPFDGSVLSSGVYIYRLQSGKFTDMKKMVLIR